MWSISVEEQFYLVAPYVMKIGNRRGLAVLSFVSIATAYVALGLLTSHHVIARRTWVDSFVQFQFFGLGIVLALLLHNRSIRLRTPTRVLCVIVGLVLFLISQVHSRLQIVTSVPSFTLASEGYFLVLVGCVFIFLGFYDAKRRFPAGILYLGRISFGLYVYQMVPFVVAFNPKVVKHLPAPLSSPPIRWVLCLLVTIAMAHISFQHFEKPFLRLKRRFSTEKQLVRHEAITVQH